MSLLDDKCFSIGEFARLSRVTRAMLLHYDKIGLLSPLQRGKDNSYRFYSIRQLSCVNLIRTLQEFGMTLNEIKAVKNQRTPTQVNELLMELTRNIDDKIDVLRHARNLLFTLRESIHSAADVNESVITIQDLHAEQIILGDINDYSNGRDKLDALLSFYDSSNEKYLDWNLLNYPVWSLVSAERIKRRDWQRPDRYYFYNPKGHDQRPAAQYAIGYTRGWYGQTGDLYERLSNYIEENGFEICGDAYEEYPLNEICIADDTNYLIRVMITVRKKGKS